MKYMYELTGKAESYDELSGKVVTKHMAFPIEAKDREEAEKKVSESLLYASLRQPLLREVGPVC